MFTCWDEESVHVTVAVTGTIFKPTTGLVTVAFAQDTVKIPFVAEHVDVSGMTLVMSYVFFSFSNSC